ncbi:hypothetical protein [Natronococcus occultus]|uniref:Small CPxCG-related zinc finger protein n=1 Tax=Natronococcus occultus SP4 TaxID=694430 RepID=L0JWB1_9EURY|nr:hypothetical protein [Natronococcus occultus]AGB36379.1 hypothetical protein Natoc_0517 [Natronococcus occultus SP4]
MNAWCPACGDCLGELIEKNRDADGVTAAFECPDCSHEWKVSL